MYQLRSSSIFFYKNGILPQQINDRKALRIYILLIGFLVCLPTALFAQMPIDSTLLVNTNTNRLGINTFDWHTNIMGRLKLLSHQQHINYTLQNDWLYNQALPSHRFVTRDFSLHASHAWQPLGNDWQIRERLQLEDFAANQTRIAQVEATLNRTFYLSENQIIQPLLGVGFSSDKRFSLTDNGLIYRAQISYEEISKDSLTQMFVSALWRQADIRPRQNQHLSATGGLSKQFSEFADIELLAGYKKGKVEDYLLPFVQSIQSDTVMGQLRLHYRFSPKLVFKSDNSVEMPNRGFYYRSFGGDTASGQRNNNNYQQTMLIATQELNWSSTKLDISSRLDIRQRQRDYMRQADATKDISETTTTWYHNIRYAPATKHTFSFSSIAQLLRVDTPSDQNNQDRDEEMYNAELAYNTRWTRAFRSTVKLSGAYRHMIFIDATQSVENYKERTLRLEPSFQWRKNNFSWNGQYSIWVTYNVRDFESEQSKNRSNRIFLTSHQIAYDFSPQYSLLADVLRRENRLSVLDWKKFSESPLDTVVTYDVSARFQRKFLNIKRKQEGRIQIGYRLFRQVRSSTAGLSQAGAGSILIGLRNIIIQHGPRVLCAWQRGRRWEIEADIWLQKSISRNRYEKTERSYIGSASSPETLAIVTRSFFPYFNVRLLYNPFQKG